MLGVKQDGSIILCHSNNQTIHLSISATDFLSDIPPAASRTSAATDGSVDHY
jgi:hypothetical protein